MIVYEIWENKETNKDVRVLHYEGVGNASFEREKFKETLKSDYDKLEFLEDGSIIFNFPIIIKKKKFWLVTEDSKYYLYDADQMVSKYMYVGYFAARESSEFKLDRTDLEIDSFLEGNLDRIEDLVKSSVKELNHTNIKEQINIVNILSDVLYMNIDSNYHIKVTEKIQEQLPKIPLFNDYDNQNEEVINDAISSFPWPPKVPSSIIYEAYDWFKEMEESCRKGVEHYGDEGDLYEHDLNFGDVKLKLLYHYYKEGSSAYIYNYIDREETTAY